MARVLTFRFTVEKLRHPDRALQSPDSAISALGGASMTRGSVDFGCGLGHGFSTRARLGWSSFNPGSRSIALGGSTGDRRQFGFEDITLALSHSSALRRDRLAARLEAGMILPSGKGQTYDNGSGLSFAPFTLGASTPFAGAALTLTASRAGAPVAVHIHAEGTFVNRRVPPEARAQAPFPERLPLLVLGPEAFNRLDLRYAFSVARGSGTLFAEFDLPLLIDAGQVIAVGEAPLTLTPGLALRAGVFDLGAQLDLSLAMNDGATAFNPHEVYPDWGFSLRFGTDWVPFDHDRDGDAIGDRSDRCPNYPEDLDGYADWDGCPDPDNDGDSIPDDTDGCPQVAEDADGFADEDGCPEADNDGDGLEDANDQCPSSAEDMDGVDDEDGCPETDPFLEQGTPTNPTPPGGVEPEGPEDRQ